MIKIYGRKGCTKCSVVKERLKKSEYNFEYYDIEKDKEALIFVREKAKELGNMNLPFIFDNDEYISYIKAMEKYK